MGCCSIFVVVLMAMAMAAVLFTVASCSQQQLGFTNINDGSIFPGNITIIWDVLGIQPTGYDATVKIQNIEMERHVEKPGWQLGWTWLQNEVIWSIAGAEATQQGNCLGFLARTLPHSCERSPRIIDLLSTDSYSPRVANCCKDGELSSLTQNMNRSVAEFSMFVGVSPNNVTVPKKFDIGVDDYTCGRPVKVQSSRNPAPDGRRYTQALLTWHIVCKYTKPRQSSCCVSLSAFYNKHMTSCRNCSCGCDINNGCQSSSHEGGSPVKCTSHMCPIGIHWHVKTNYKGYWLVRLTITNFNSNKNYSDWNVLIRHRSLGSLVTISNFQYSSLNLRNDTWLFWGKPFYSNILSLYQQTDLLMKKEEGIFTFEDKWVFPQRVHFNGDECTLPDVSEYPTLPHSPKLFPMIGGWMFIIIFTMGMAFMLYYIRRFILGAYW